MKPFVLVEVDEGGIGQPEVTFCELDPDSIEVIHVDWHVIEGEHGASVARDIIARIVCCFGTGETPAGHAAEVLDRLARFGEGDEGESELDEDDDPENDAIIDHEAMMEDEDRERDHF